MTYKELTSWNKLELRIYNLLGIKYFQKAMLLYERIRHHKDNRKNENYHPSNFNVLALEQYEGFLLYNAFLHGVSLLFCGVYLILTLAYGVRIIVADVFMVLLSLINLYCILLQRNIHLKLKDYCYRYYNRFYKRAHLVSNDILQRITAQKPQQIQADFEVVCRIRKAFEGRADCILNASDTDSLKRLREYVEPIPQKKSNWLTKGVTEVGLIEKCSSISGPYTSLQRRADWLQKRFNLSGHKILDHTVVLTADMECEAHYRELVPEGSEYKFYFACLILDEVMAGIVDKVRGNEA